MSKAGISNPVDISAHGSKGSDVSFTIGLLSQYPYNAVKWDEFEYTDYYTGEETSLPIYKIDKNWRITKSGDEIAAQIKALSIDGQINLFGYSTGSVIMAQTALYLANEKNIKIDNLILLGTTIHNNSELMKALNSNPKIGTVWRIDILLDNTSAAHFQALAVAGGYGILGNKHPHFKYAFWPDASSHRMTLFTNEFKKKMGIK